MAGFHAENVVDPLEWDFAPYVNAHGTTPEPTDRQIAEFLSGLKAVVKEAEEAGGGTPDDSRDPAAVLEAIDNLDPEKNIEQMAKVNALYSALCSGMPSTEQISQLPMRVRTIFFTWLQQEVMAPEAAGPGGNGQVRNLPTARAG